MRTFFALLAMFHSMAYCGSPNDDASAAFALALASTPAKSTTPTTPRAHTSEVAAREEAIRTGKPLVIRYGSLDCSAVCNELDAIVAHVDGDTKPLLRLLVFSPRDSSWYYDEWSSLPNVNVVKSRLVELLKHAGSRPSSAKKTVIDWNF